MLSSALISAHSVVGKSVLNVNIIIHNISANVCILYVIIMYLNSVYGFCAHIYLNSEL